MRKMRRIWRKVQRVFFSHDAYRLSVKETHKGRVKYCRLCYKDHNLTPWKSGLSVQVFVGLMITVVVIIVALVW